MIDNFSAILGGLVLLGLGGEIMVRGAYSLSLRLKLTPAVIGLTVMAVGTSLPEMVTSIVAQMENSPDMSLGNIVGSNIFNIGCVLGFCGLIRALRIPGNTVRLEWPFMFISSCLLLLLARDGEIDRLEGGFFLISFAIFTAFMVRLARIEVGRQESASFQSAVEEVTDDRHPLLLPISFVFGGGVALWFGADYLVEGCKAIARQYDVSERIIAVTVVAAGTGLPEFFATLVAVLHKKTDMAIGNVVGSNICNILLVGGVASSIKPLLVNPVILSNDLWWMLGISLLLGPFIAGSRLNRAESFILLVLYVIYAVTLFVRFG